MNAVRLANRESSNASSGMGVQLSEWEKSGWTYHAKGKCYISGIHRYERTFFKAYGCRRQQIHFPY
jgi:hypothetical protein